MTGIKTTLHNPVLLEEVIDTLKVQKGIWYVDCTLGFGGHSKEILKLGGKILGIEQDRQTLNITQKDFDKEFDKQSFILVSNNFRTLKTLVAQNNIKPSGVLFDLGMSSWQLDNSGRGFSFRQNEELDMRMDTDNLAVKAKDLINGLYENELEKLFANYGEEPLSRQIAHQLVKKRQTQAINNTTELTQICRDVYRHHYKSFSTTDPATKVFQALRIVVNDEINALNEGLQGALDTLVENGKLLVITFHGTEDRIVKKTFQEWEKSGFGSVLANKAILPTAKEIETNNRSHSAKLRVFEKK